MAIYHLHMKNISRGDGRSAVACAAYRAGETLPNEAEERDSNFGGRRDVRYAAIILPEGAPAWMGDRSQLWNAVEAAEKRKDARLAKEVEVALPRELSFAQQLAAVEALARAFTAAGLVVDFSLHDDGQSQNPHAHLMMTTRAITAAGFGQKLRGTDDRAFLTSTRALWAKIANQALGKIGASVEIDHRSNAARDIAERPGVHRGVDRDERVAKRQARDRAGEFMDRETLGIRQVMAQSEAMRRTFPALAVREDWPPATRTPPRDYNAAERVEHRKFWREVDRRVIDSDRTAEDQREHEGGPTTKDIGQIVASVDRDTMPDLVNDALRQFAEMQERLNATFAARGITIENSLDMATLNQHLAEFRRTLLDIRMREIGAFERIGQEERDMPAPGPDRMPISPQERDEAQERMIAEVEREAYPETPRPAARPTLADWRSKRQLEREDVLATERERDR